MADNKPPKASTEAEPFPVEEEAPVPKGVPQTPEDRAAMMAAENAAAHATATQTPADSKENAERAAQMATENAEGHATAVVETDDKEDAAQRADLMAKENTGVMVPEAAFKKTM